MSHFGLWLFFSVIFQLCIDQHDSAFRNSVGGGDGVGSWAHESISSIFSYAVL